MTGFSHVGKRLIDEMRNLGVTICTTATAFPNLDDISGDNEVKYDNDKMNMDNITY